MANVQIVIMIKGLKNSRDLKTKVNKLVEKGINLQLYLKKKHGHFKNQNNFLNLKLSTVWFEGALLVTVVFIKLKEVLGSKLKTFMAPATSSEKEEAKVTDQFLSCTGEDPGRDIYSLILVPAAEGYLAV